MPKRKPLDRRRHAAQHRQNEDPFRKMPIVDTEVKRAYRCISTGINAIEKIVKKDRRCTLYDLERLKEISIEPFYLYAEKLKNGLRISHYPHLTASDITSAIRIIGLKFKETNEMLEDACRNGDWILPRLDPHAESRELIDLIDETHDRLMSSMLHGRRNGPFGTVSYELRMQQMKKFIVEIVTVVNLHFILKTNLGVNKLADIEKRMISIVMEGEISPEDLYARLEDSSISKSTFQFYIKRLEESGAIASRNADGTQERKTHRIGDTVALDADELRMLSWMKDRLKRVIPSKSLASIDPASPMDDRIAFTVAFPPVDESMGFKDRVQELRYYLHDCAVSTERVIPHAEEEFVLWYIEWAAREMPGDGQAMGDPRALKDDFIDTKRDYLTSCILLRNRKTADFAKSISDMSEKLRISVRKVELAERGKGQVRKDD